jgi:hypothetical protein
MKKNLSQEEQLMRIGFGSLLLTWGLLTKNRTWLIGLLPLATGIMTYCPVKKALTNLIENQNRTAYENSEMNNPKIDADDDSGGYRTGRPDGKSSVRPKADPVASS